MRAIVAAGCAVLIAGGGIAAVAQTPVPGSAAASRLGHGYLEASAFPDSLVLVPPLPGPRSPAIARDKALQKQALKLRDGPRWALATADAELFAPSATGAFSCAAGLAIGPQSTPLTDKLLRRTMADLGIATGRAKKAYERQRPFMVNRAPTCTPAAEPYLRNDGSYPSGHAAIGYGWGLILAELVPARAAELTARGRVFADSRRVCNVHWQSDTEEGRNVGAAVVAALHANPEFVADLAAARVELVAASARPSAETCAAEAAAIAQENK